MDAVTFLDEDEPMSNKIKSISPHFKHSSSRVPPGRTLQSFKNLTMNTRTAKGINSLAINHVPVATSGCSISKRFADAQTQAASIQSYSQKFVALKRVKPLKVKVIGKLPIDDGLFEANSRTSLCDSADVEVEELPPSLQHSMLQNTKNHSPEAAVHRDQASSQATESLDIMAKKVPIKIIPRKNQDNKSGFDRDSWVQDKPIQCRDQLKININSKFHSQTAVKEIRPLKEPSTLVECPATVPFEWGDDEQRQELPSMVPRLISSCLTQRAVQMDSSPRRSALDSPCARNNPKSTLGEHGSHLLELVAPDDGFDLDILSIAENQASSPSRVQAKKASRMFNFDDCSFIVPQQVPARRSFDCGSNRQGIAIELNDRYPQTKQTAGSEDFSQRAPSKRVTLSPKRHTSKPLLINFDRLKEMAKDFKHPVKTRIRHMDSATRSPGLCMVQDL